MSACTHFATGAGRLAPMVSNEADDPIRRPDDATLVEAGRHARATAEGIALKQAHPAPIGGSCAGHWPCPTC